MNLKTRDLTTPLSFFCFCCSTFKGVAYFSLIPKLLHSNDVITKPISCLPATQQCPTPPNLSPPTHPPNFYCSCAWVLLSVHAIGFGHVLLGLRAGVHIHGGEARRGLPHQVAAAAGVAADAGVAVVGLALGSRPHPSPSRAPGGARAPASPEGAAGRGTARDVGRQVEEEVVVFGDWHGGAAGVGAGAWAGGQVGAVGGTGGDGAAQPRAGHALHQAGHRRVCRALKVHAVEHLQHQPSSGSILVWCVSVYVVWCVSVYVVCECMWCGV